jgi:hypothetical protein
MKTGFQPQSSMCKVRDTNLIGNYLLIMGRWKQYFYETINVKDDMEIREKVIYLPERQIDPPTKDEAYEIIGTLKHNKSPREGKIIAEFIKYGDKTCWEEIHALI